MVYFRNWCFMNSNTVLTLRKQPRTFVVWIVEVQLITLHKPDVWTSSTCSSSQSKNCPVGWGCRIHWLLLCRGVRPPPHECLGYDTKHSDGEVPVVLVLWGMRSTPSLPLLPGPLWPGVVAPDGLNRTNSILMLNWIVWLNWIAWNRNVFDS